MMIHKEIKILPFAIKASMYLEENMVSSTRNVKIFMIKSYNQPVNCLC